MPRAFLLCVVCVITVAGADGPRDCGRLKSLSLPDTTISTAEFVGAGPFVAPGSGAGNQRPSPAPAHCRVNAVIRPSSDSGIEIELWLPVSGWNGKFLAVGNGGWSGNIRYDGLV